MECLIQRDLRALFQFLRGLYAHLDLETLTRQILSARTFTRFP